MAEDPVILLWGDSPFLLREAAHRALGETPFSEVDGDDWRTGLTGDLATPSLLGEPRALLVSNAQDLPEEALREIAAYALAPDPSSRLVLAASVTARAKGPPAKLNRSLQGRARIQRIAVDRKELPKWVLGRAKQRGVPASSAGVNALIETVGEDPALLAQSVVQVADAFPAEGLTPETVASQFRGLGDRRIWDLCDAAFSRDAPASLRHLTAMLEAREQPLAILGGVAARLRELIRVRSLPGGLPLAQVARAAGLRFDWQARRYRDQARRFRDGELEELHTRVVDADAQIKLGGAGETVLTVLVARIAIEPAPAR